MLAIAAILISAPALLPSPVMATTSNGNCTLGAVLKAVGGTITDVPTTMTISVGFYGSCLGTLSPNATATLSPAVVSCDLLVGSGSAKFTWNPSTPQMATAYVEGSPVQSTWVFADQAGLSFVAAATMVWGDLNEISSCHLPGVGVTVIHLTGAMAYSPV